MCRPFRAVTNYPSLRAVVQPSQSIYQLPRQSGKPKRYGWHPLTRTDPLSATSRGGSY
ncbi:hypothetical protein HSB1_27060 [Halogranum salarium B-1]|uniref:Uncharacterized protein n=1 Tax=Halogranum salarium B-1 TaxID=1210908 RepID=J2ZF28_9EURY|nr:hypothetical protein HSB1_27060 [Halogranum salarium B-1]